VSLHQWGQQRKRSHSNLHFPLVPEENSLLSPDWYFKVSIPTLLVVVMFFVTSPPSSFSSVRQSQPGKSGLCEKINKNKKVLLPLLHKECILGWPLACCFLSKKCQGGPGRFGWADNEYFRYYCKAQHKLQLSWTELVLSSVLHQPPSQPARIVDCSANLYLDITKLECKP
jgi:hypothetical protein